MHRRFRAIGISAVLVAAALACLPARAGADTYTVTRTDDPPPDACLPTDCSLREALEASNASTAVDNLIFLPAGLPYMVEFESKPLEIEDQVEIHGAESSQSTIRGTEAGFVVHNNSPGVVLSDLRIEGGLGGIQNDGELTLRRVSVDGNYGAGGIRSSGPLLVDSSFVGFNRSDTYTAGGIQAELAATILNSTVAHNISLEGTGGIYGSRTLTITSSAVVFNRSLKDRGAGVFAQALRIRDSIFAGNEDPNGVRNCTAVSQFFPLGGTVDDEDSCTGGIGDWPNVDPLLGTLNFHGGTTPVYDLLAGSPAIDAAAQCPPFDQRGVPRPLGAACDSGPYEFISGLPPSATPPPDRELFMRVKRELRLAKNAIWVRLTCPATEASPPCRGRVSVLDPPLIFHGPRTLQARPLEGKFSIWAGRTKWVPLREPHGRGKRLPKEQGKWEVSLLVLAEDGAGNRWKYLKKRRALIRR